MFWHKLKFRGNFPVNLPDKQVAGKLRANLNINAQNTHLCVRDAVPTGGGISSKHCNSTSPSLLVYFFIIYCIF